MMPLAGGWNWVVGMYYLNMDHTRDRSFTTDLALGTFLGDIFPGAADPAYYKAILSNETDSISGFFQGTFSILDNLRLTAGGRYTHDKKKGREYAVRRQFYFFSWSIQFTRIGVLVEVYSAGNA